MNDLIHIIKNLSNNFSHDEKKDSIDAVKSAVFFLFSNTPELSILLLKRSKKLNNHAGEICFPGGTYKPSDGNLIQTAYRETFEEAGISKENIKWVSSLNHEDTRTGFRIYPFLGIIDNEAIINIDNSEIVKYISVPVKHLQEVLNLKKLWFINKNNSMYFKPLFYFQNELIWGATAAIIYNFLNRYISIKHAR